MALRKPTVCFLTTENKQTAGEAALYAADNDITAFVKHTIRLMDDPALRESMGQLARRRIDDGLTWRHQTAELLKLYDDLFDLTARKSPVIKNQDEALTSDVACEQPPASV